MIHLINSNESVQFFLKIFAEDVEKSSVDEKFITVDTEFIRENLEYPLLCLIQIATSENAFIIDPLAIDISFLKKIFSNEKLPKIFHSAIQDIEILYSSNIFIKNIYDTQSYEMLLSTKEQISYQSIVFKYLGKRLDKDYSLSDWKKRPLSKKQIKYSIGDVTFLREIYKRQKKKLEDLNRLSWLIPEMKNLEQIHTNVNDENIKIFHQLYEWIENRAKEKNINAKSIADEHAIKRICKKGKPYISKMLKYRGLINDDFKDFLIFAKEIAPDDISDRTKHTPIVGALKLILEICSEKNNVAPMIIANTNELEKLVRDFKSSNIDIRCINGWRKEIFGKYALDFLNKKITLAFNNDQLGFIER